MAKTGTKRALVVGLGLTGFSCVRHLAARGYDVTVAVPRGATPIDFAYAVHTDLGSTTGGAKVNGAHVPLHTPLRNGDQVEIIRTKEQTPSPLWEQFVVTGRARAEIRRFLRHAQRDEHVAFGRKILEKAFADHNFELTPKGIEDVTRKLRLARDEDVYAEVGRGALRAQEVLEAVFPEIKRDPSRKKADSYAPGPGDGTAPAPPAGGAGPRRYPRLHHKAARRRVGSARRSARIGGGAQLLPLPDARRDSRQSCRACGEKPAPSPHPAAPLEREGCRARA